MFVRIRQDRGGFRVLPWRWLAAHAFGFAFGFAFGWLMPPRRLARGTMVTASMIIATVMNLLHFRG